MRIGDRIKLYRESKGWTQEELAKKIGVTPQAIYKYEKGIVTNIPLEKISVMSKALGIDPQKLAGWEKNNTSENTEVLAPENEELLALYNVLDEEQKKFIVAQLKILIDLKASKESNE